MLITFIIVQLMKINFKKINALKILIIKINLQEQIVFKEQIQQKKNRVVLFLGIKLINWILVFLQNFSN